jgi:hypothetical protein
MAWLYVKGVSIGDFSATVKARCGGSCQRTNPSRHGPCDNLAATVGRALDLLIRPPWRAGGPVCRCSEVVYWQGLALGQVLGLAPEARVLAAAGRLAFLTPSETSVESNPGRELAVLKAENVLRTVATKTDASLAKVLLTRIGKLPNFNTAIKDRSLRH